MGLGKRGCARDWFWSLHRRGREWWSDSSVCSFIPRPFPCPKEKETDERDWHFSPWIPFLQVSLSGNAVDYFRSHIIGVVLASFQQPQPSASAYPAPDVLHSMFSYFPQLPQRHGPGSYKADNQQQTANDDKCWKYCYMWLPYTHSQNFNSTDCILAASMGCVMVLKPHPFQLFTTRFTSPASVTVYDNVCQLHTYGLNRVPQWFKRTLLLTASTDVDMLGAQLVTILTCTAHTRGLNWS